MDRPQTHAEAQIFGIAQSAFNPPTTTVQAGQLLGGCIGAAGGQAPSLLHIRILNADDGCYRVAIGGDRGAAQHTCASASLHPGGSGASFATGGGYRNVAAEADDVVEIQFFSQHLVKLLITEAAIGNDTYLDPCWQQFGQPHQHAMLIECAVVLERLLVDGQPNQRGRATVIGDQCQHDGGLFVGIEVGPVHGHHDAVPRANDERHPAHQNIVDVDRRIGQQPVDLLDRMLGFQTTGGGEALANRTDRQRAAVQHAKGGIAEGIDTLGVKILLQQAAENVVNCLVRETLPDDHSSSRIGVGGKTRWSAESRESLPRLCKDLPITPAPGFFPGSSCGCSILLCRVENEGMLEAYTNTVEGYVSILKRGIYGVYQHVSEAHLQRYLTELSLLQPD